MRPEHLVVAETQPPRRPPAGAASLEAYGYRQELKRTLSFADLVVYGLIFMVPVAPMGIYGQVAQTARGMVVLVYAVGLIGMMATALSYAAMSEAFPVAGSVYSYVQRGWHPRLGFLAGWLILLDYILIPALLSLISAAWLSQLMPHVPSWVWVGAFAALATAINVAGIQVTNRANWLILALELVTFAAFCMAALAYVAVGKGGAAFTLAPVYQPHGFSLSLIGAATSIAVLSFLGFDGISTLAEEARGGRKTVGRATVCALVVVAGLFMCLTYLAAVVAPDVGHFPHPDAAFYDIAGRVGGDGLRLLCLATTVIACFANALSAQAAIARLLYGMGRDGALPRLFAKVHHRYQTPYAATTLVGVVTLLVGMVSNIQALSSLVNFGALTAFLLLNLTVVIHFCIRLRSRRWFRHLALPLFGFAVLAYVWVNFDRLTLLMGLAWAGAGAVALALRQRVRRAGG